MRREPRVKRETMRWVADKSGRFPQRPVYTKRELDDRCEELHNVGWVCGAAYQLALLEDVPPRPLTHRCTREGLQGAHHVDRMERQVGYACGALCRRAPCARPCGPR
jgi:hypothetical protein